MPASAFFSLFFVGGVGGFSECTIVSEMENLPAQVYKEKARSHTEIEWNPALTFHPD